MTKIFLRSNTGKLIDLPEDVAFVELHGDEGRVGMVLGVTENGRILEITSESPEAPQYRSLFGVDFIPVRGLTGRHAKLSHPAKHP